MIGETLSHFEITAKLGEGGMGAVYRATDSKLGREVALKVLPEAFTEDAERLSRFEREARLLATLNHAGIAQIHEVGEQDGTHFLVMELVEGEDLAEILKRGPLPVDRALKLAEQIAAGLETAHESGIVHRDLKPANVMVKSDGTAKLLDFGIAKMSETGVQGDLTHSPTLSRGPTQMGVLLGTAPYMSPEQARGLPVDKRADVWAFGCMLYEMLTGARAFPGEDVTLTLATVMKSEPNWGSLPKGLSSVLRSFLERSLVKDSAERLRDVGDLRLAIQGAFDPAIEDQSSSLASRPRQRWLWLASALVVGAAGGFWLRGSPDIPNSELSTYRMRPFAVEERVEAMPAWSPDGTTLAYAAVVEGFYQIFTRRLDQTDGSVLTALDFDCLYPAWNPAGERLYFLARDLTDPRTGDPSELWVVGAAGGQPEKILESIHAFALAPDGEHVVVVRRDMGSDGYRYRLEMTDLAGGTESQRLFELPVTDLINIGSSGMSFSPDGALLAASLGWDFVVLRDPLESAGSVTIEELQIEGRAAAIWGASWTPNGRGLVISLRENDVDMAALWHYRLADSSLQRLTASQSWEYHPSVSPDGTQIAFHSSSLDWDIFEIDLESGRFAPLVASTLYDGWGNWVDNERIVYSTQRDTGFELRLRDLERATERVVVSTSDFPNEDASFLVQGEVSPDGRSVAYVTFAEDTTIYVSSLSGSRPVRLTPSEEALREDSPSWSPDGRWIAFTRAAEVRKALASGGSESVLLADDARTALVRWLPSGDRLVYESDDGLVSVSADGEDRRVITNVRPLFWDVSRSREILFTLEQDERRNAYIRAVDVASGVVEQLATLGRVPLSPDVAGYPDTLRALRVSPDGKRALLAYLQPRADIWILEGVQLH